MTITTKFYSLPFAVSGDLTAVPTPSQSDGSISYTQGWPYDYQRNLATDPAALAVDRGTMNQLFLDITTNLQQFQQYGAPNFITSADNGGSPFSYAKNSIVFQPADGNIYQSNTAANTTVPPGASWTLFIPGGTLPSIGAYNLLLNNTNASAAPAGHNIATVAALVNALTGFTAGAGTVTGTDSLLTAIQKLAGNIAVLSTPKTRVTYQVSSGTNSPNSTQNTWTAKTLNTIVYDDIGITLSSNQITLPAGTYEVSGTAGFGATNFGGGNARLQLYNVTDSAFISSTTSNSVQQTTPQNQNMYPLLNKVRFTIATSKNISVYYYTDSDSPTYAASSGAGIPEIYADFVITKIG